MGRSDKARTQHLVMRRTAALADRVILPASSVHLAWLTCSQNKVVFIPVGSNIPAPSAANCGSSEDGSNSGPGARMVAVFGITPGARGEQEIARHA